MTILMTAKRNLILQASQAAADARDQAGVDDIDPIDVYAVADRLGLRVRFLKVSMEGLYKKGPPAITFLSSLRPVPRRAFTCGHELGHHWFGHGSTIDELKEDDRKSSDKPEEILADAFSSFLLMPSIGIRRAFASRKWDISAPSPLQIATVASEFGVGYGTLISHLTYVLHHIDVEQRAALLKTKPQQIRRSLIADDTLTALPVFDRHSLTSTVDLDIGNGIALPMLSEIRGEGLDYLKDGGDFAIYKATKRTQLKVRTGMRQMTVRIGPTEYEGLMKHRHVEEEDDD